MSARQREVFDRIVAGKRGKLIGPLRAALHAPELADRWQLLGEYLRYDSGLPPQLSELAIIMTGRYWNCQLEWVVHARIAAGAGLSRDIIEAIRLARPPALRDQRQRAVYEFTRELLARGQVADGVYAELQQHLDTTGLVELTALVGYYSMVAMTLNAHRVPLPADEDWPPLVLDDSVIPDAPTRLPAATTASES